MKKYIFLLLAVLVLVSWLGVSPNWTSSKVTEEVTEKVTESDLIRACAKIGNSPEYQALSVFTDEYYKLQDKAGDEYPADSLLLRLTLQNIEFKTKFGGSYFDEACKSVLREHFMGVEP